MALSYVPHSLYISYLEFRCKEEMSPFPFYLFMQLFIRVRMEPGMLILPFGI